jgi:hypothetical protein
MKNKIAITLILFLMFTIAIPVAQTTGSVKDGLKVADTVTKKISNDGKITAESLIWVQVYMLGILLAFVAIGTFIVMWVRNKFGYPTKPRRKSYNEDSGSVRLETTGEIKNQISNIYNDTQDIKSLIERLDSKISSIDSNTSISRDKSVKQAEHISSIVGIQKEIDTQQRSIANELNKIISYLDRR